MSLGVIWEVRLMLTVNGTQICKVTAAYFLLVFGAGFVLGTARVLLLVPQVGERAAAALVLAADLVVGIGLRGMSAHSMFLDRDPVSGGAYYAMVIAFAVAPYVFAARRPPG
ncbi:MAG: hypothetical protein IRY99_09270 [Isosphaeraceae bacterium]|nr:hypothetical protein [Isosphaeraceae bacterium]